VTRGKLSFHCHIISFVDSVLTRDKLTLTVGRSQRNKQTWGDFSFADVGTSSLKAVDLIFGVTASGVFGLQEGHENISNIKQYQKKLRCNALE